MSRKRKYHYYVGDFETTVYQGQTFTEVWASAIVELGSEKVQILHSIDDTFNYLKSLKQNVAIYYHNLKFDGCFWLDYLINKLKFEQATTATASPEVLEWREDADMFNNTFKYTISDMGQWYTITIKVNNYMLEIRDSLKLLPFSVKEIGRAFNTKHQKLDMEYEGLRYAGCIITDEEQDYIKNDVLVVKEALEIMFAQGHDKITIGACCLSEFKKIMTKDVFDYLFPDLTVVALDPERFGSDTVDKYVRRSYKGGWCYLARGKESRAYKDGITADVNSLYPSMMSSESGNKYPTGMPTFWTGNYIPEVAQDEKHYYFIRIRTRFYIKPGMLPFIQIKGSFLYHGTEMLESSDVKNKAGKAFPYYIGFDGELKDTRVVLTLTCTDYILFREHYDVKDFEILDGCYFKARVGIFDDYINKYKKIKLESKGALRTLAKLFLNNLYGKMAASSVSSFKVAYPKETGELGFYSVDAEDKKPGFIPVGSAITSYARNFTIRAAQLNYYGPDKPGFIYADTDSIHCDLAPDQIRGLPVHDKNFCCWKLEASWDFGLFIRQKTYIEHVTKEDLQPVEKPYYNIKCAGLPERCKRLFLRSIGEEVPEEKISAAGLEFIQVPRQVTDFKPGLRIPGKLMPKRIPGGMILIDSFYELRA